MSDSFVFERSPWELAAQKLLAGDRIGAARFLALLEGEEEEYVEDAFLTLEDRRITLDLTDLPKAAGTGEAAVRLRREEQLVREDSLMTALEETDPLRLYLEELAGIPAWGDENVLALELLKGDRERASNQLMNLSLSRIVELAKEYVGRGVLLMDLIQEGSMGLWMGLNAYNGGDFGTFRDWWIRQYMSKAAVMQARANGVGQKMRQAMEDYRSVDERLLTDLGRNPTLEEIAAELHMDVEEAATVADMLSSARNFSRAEAPDEAPAQENEQAVEDTAYFQMRQRISELLSVLPERDAKILTLRFGLEGGLPMSPEDTGKKLGLTAEEVVAAEGAALAKLRNQRS